ncbi:MAG: RNA 2',3'-cyclic phosphodiesterase [Candidatus Hydrogenedentales bacterium]|jgi:2'-5' RNA ligase
MRAFVAIELPGEIKRQLLNAAGRLRHAHVRASWVKAESMHVTLRFFGDIGQREADMLIAHVEPRFAEAQLVALSVRGIGAFPNVRKPSVVWAGVGPLEGALESVHGIAEWGALAIGQKAEGRRFHPHITLARLREGDGGRSREAVPTSRASVDELAVLIERERETEFGAFTATSVSLFSSELTPQGPIHTRVKEFRLS